MSAAWDNTIQDNEVNEHKMDIGLNDRVLGFGEARRRGIRYYEYEDSDAYSDSQKHRKSIADTDELNDRDFTQVEMDFDEDAWNQGFSFRRLFQFMGPGWLMSIAYLDPGNLESDLQSGARTGYQLLWVLFWATVFGWAIQNLASRLGTVTGRHLAEVCRTEYNKPTALALWILTELAIIGSDIQEIVGSAIAFKLLFGLPLFGGCLITALDTFTFMAIHYYGVRKLEGIFCLLIGVMAITFGINFFRIAPPVGDVMYGWVVPGCDPGNGEFAVGLIGAVIMPHNLFLHSALVDSRKIQRKKKAAVQEANYYFLIESGFSLLISFFINLFVVCVFAKGFHGTANEDNIGLKDAGDFLREEFGTSYAYIWGIGLLAAGQSSTMTGTFAGQYAMQGFINIRWAPWKRTLLTRSIALVPALFVAISAQDIMDSLDEWLNVQQSVQLPFALIPLLVFNSDARIMGDFKLKWWQRICYWLTAIAIIAVNCFIAVDTVINKIESSVGAWVLFGIFMFTYLGFSGYLIFDYYFNVARRQIEVTDPNSGYGSLMD